MVYSKCCTDSRCFTDCHGNCHNSVRCHGFVRSRDTSSCQNQIFHFLRYQTSPGDIISIHILCNSVCLTAALPDYGYLPRTVPYELQHPETFSLLSDRKYSLHIFRKTSALTNSRVEAPVFIVQCSYPGHTCEGNQ